MRWLVVALVLPCVVAMGASLPGCGPDPRRVRALDALEITRRAVTEVDSSGGESTPAIRSALEDVNARLLETEHAYDLWGGATGSMAFERMAACLSVALGDLRDALSARDGEAAPELETAQLEMASFTERPCRRRR